MSTRIVLLGGLVASSVLFASSAFGQGAFGTFAAEPAGQWISVPGGRPNFVLSEDFLYTDPDNLAWLAPKGTKVDGASIPQILWSWLGGPFDGDYLHASIIHDHFCDTRVRTSDATHLAFYYGMLAKGVAGWKASTMYWGVAAFGPKWTLEPRIVQSEVCMTSDAGVSCAVTSTIREELVALPGPDLADPAVRAVAEAKLEAIARTLKTTDGATLDVGPLGTVQATPDSIRQSSQTFADLIETNAHINRPDLLGIMAVPSGATLDELPEWPGGVVPQFDLSPDLGTIGNADLEAFRLEPGDLQVLEDRLIIAPESFEFPAVNPSP